MSGSMRNASDDGRPSFSLAYWAIADVKAGIDDDAASRVLAQAAPVEGEALLQIKRRIVDRLFGEKRPGAAH